MRGNFFHARGTVDDVFEASLIVKAIDGAVETLGGLLLFFATPKRVTTWLAHVHQTTFNHGWTASVAEHMIHWASTYKREALILAAVYLLSHGAIKLLLVIAVLRNQLWAYPALIAVTTLFVVYQLVHVILGPSLGYILLTVFDLFVIYLTAIEYKKQTALRRKG